ATVRRIVATSDRWSSTTGSTIAVTRPVLVARGGSVAEPPRTVRDPHQRRAVRSPVNVRVHWRFHDAVSPQSDTFGHMTTSALTPQELRRLVEEVLGRYGMTIEEFVAADIDELESDELRDMWLMTR